MISEMPILLIEGRLPVYPLATSRKYHNGVYQGSMQARVVKFRKSHYVSHNNPASRVSLSTQY